MDIIVSMARSMLYISGLNPDTFWPHALALRKLETTLNHNGSEQKKKRKKVS
jgi:hypothetical protein